MTRDQECVRFLQSALPRLGYRWTGFRRVRRQVCRRVRRRCRELGLDGLADYAELLERDPEEWPRLDTCCRVTISRFHRDRRVWEILGADVLPGLYGRVAERDPARVRIWSAGCGAGEEPYTLAMLLRLGPAPRPQEIAVEIVATDLDEHQLERARRAIYPESSVRELPEDWRRQAFVLHGASDYRLLDENTEGVSFLRQDLRRGAPDGLFDLVLCRNLAFTYFDSDGQARALSVLLDHLAPFGWLALGSHEEPPDGSGLQRHPTGAPLFALPRQTANWPPTAGSGTAPPPGRTRR